MMRMCCAMVYKAVWENMCNDCKSESESESESELPREQW
jgi:hypothetical protein